jgi:four helix bundle protein
MSIRDIEDLNVWQEARLLCNDIYILIKFFPEVEKFNIIKHLRENARGVPANIAEGFYRFHYQDSIRFYLIARGCLGEIKSDLYISCDREYIKQAELNDFLIKIEKILKMLNSLIRASNEQKNKSSYN